MKATNTLIIGAGQCGLAMGRALAAKGVDHILLDAGKTAHRWQTERWDSLKMLTPNWMNSLNKNAPKGADPDGFMPAHQMTSVLTGFAHENGLAVQEDTRVLSVRAEGGAYQVQTDQGAIAAKQVVVATGACAKPAVPALASDLRLPQFPSQAYKRPSDLPEGGVLVVGASASGLNIARELAASGRAVTLSVGSHMRLPRSYRNADICAWMHLVGAFDEEAIDPNEIKRLRRLPSLPLVGNAEHATVDLNSLEAMGCRIVGRFCGARDNTALFSGSLANACASADLKMTRLLDSVDAWIDAAGLTDLFPSVERPAPTRVPADPEVQMNLSARGITSIVWATGYRPDHSFLDLPVFDRKGQIKHTGGVVGDGLYVLGLPYLRTARSTHVDGARRDADAVATHLISKLERSLAA